MIAEPCAVETPVADARRRAAGQDRRCGVTARRGVRAPRTSPHAYQRLGEARLRILADVGADGVMIDMYSQPTMARCDGDQALIESDVHEVANAAAVPSPVMGRGPAQPIPQGA